VVIQTETFGSMKRRLAATTAHETGQPGPRTVGVIGGEPVRLRDAYLGAGSPMPTGGVQSDGSASVGAAVPNIGIRFGSLNAVMRAIRSPIRVRTWMPCAVYRPSRSLW
jgi:hypothetical protein